MDWNNFMLQLDYRTPFNPEEQAYYEHIAEGLDRQLSKTIEWFIQQQQKMKKKIKIKMIIIIN